jgi:IS1 family transposase
MLLRGSGIRDCSEVLGISRDAVLRCILRSGLSLEIKPLQKRYTRVQIDELWSYVGHKEKKVWMIYAYCAESAEILAFTLGKRSKRTVEYLMLRLKNAEIDFFLTDDWEAFAAVLPYEKHLSGKQFTKAIEGRNTWFRTRLRRLARRTVCFSKKLKYHFAMIKILIYHKKYQLSYI